uniref:VWFA domain-containing protein n=1 Tax=Paramoeba aestuarina TaxID=180227 RepID=A0A7S4KS93_9EUKA|mmetsp:Transcript_24497/g.38205  ORF Transcript_24497/g.38205 Transcript_24497/m.38205 type:complete len:434 (+) Transcript_24497:117-1418(+)|eukprot:CAMPEP_0201536954 /NCGR_PEP_ID=MMETSP0161_2-20130828/63362_1 /ASSEMBLY_ACC=CAM_ASM_000251 /TAXON_ID=180227 /ORGANISM="Neoparamoeba aestuarina, Strain SoJaBio B1-5/56/2" /LENGTH=433 /DNA_ID=CAMNT_0047942969 /DNA_START=83 /DNA_END=1384 /DNA_ORIENTATION=+
MADTNDLITMKASVGPSAVMRGMKNSTHVYFDIVTGEKTETARPPVDLCIVLDRSGSMASKGKLKTAKAAMKSVVEGLSGGDRFAVILYDTGVETLFGLETYDLSKEKELVLSQIDAIKTKGCTNLYGGLEEGLKQFSSTTDKTRNQKIFLFSDGLVNAGIQDSKKILALATSIADKGIGLDSFGVGDDFNEDLMRDIGENGCGRFLFVEDADAMEQFVSFAMKGIFALVARHAKLKVRGAGDGVAEKMYGGDLLGGFVLNDLTTNNSRGVLVEATLSPKECGNVELLKWELTYKDLDNQERSLTGIVHVEVTEDEKKVREVNVPVEVARQIRLAVEIDLEIEKLLDQNKRDEAIKRKKAYMEGLDELLKLDEDNIKLKSHVLAQKRAMKDLEDRSVSIQKNRKLGKKNMYKAMHDSGEYCMNDYVHEIKKVS